MGSNGRALNAFHHDLEQTQQTHCGLQQILSSYCQRKNWCPLAVRYGCGNTVSSLTIFPEHERGFYLILISHKYVSLLPVFPFPRPIQRWGL